MREIRLKASDVLSDEDARAFAGKMLKEGEGYTALVSGEDTTVYKPDGSVLVIYLSQAVPRAICETAWTNLREAASPTNNRGMAGGEIDEHLNPDFIADGSTRARKMKKDGTISKTTRARTVRSGVVGYYDRNSRFPYCRMTAWCLANPEKFLASVPYIVAVNDVFRRHAPEQYAAQHRAIKKANPDFYINDTVFSTVTVNKNWQTAVHQDAGDFRGGLGVMSALCAGDYKGCYTVFPQYGVAIDLRTGDIGLGDVHEWHGNTPFHGALRGSFERITCVFYMRAKIAQCLSYAEELERVANRKVGDKL